MATVFKRGKNYYYSFIDGNGKRQTKSARTTDKKAANRIANKHEADAALRRENVIDAAAESISKESRRPIAEHVADYKTKLKSKQGDPQHVKTTIRCITAICEAEKFSTAADINADAVNRYAGKLDDAGRSARTVQAYLTAIKGFTKWLTVHDKLTRDPLAKVAKPNPKAKRVKERRMLLPDEWQLLRTKAAAGPERFEMKGAERALLYEVAIQTGLRANELRELTRGGLHLSAARPYIMCKAGSTKNKKTARQFIRRETADALSAHITIKAPKAPVFALPSKFDMADMIRADLADARSDWIKAAKHDADERQRIDQKRIMQPVANRRLARYHAAQCNAARDTRPLSSTGRAIDS